MASRDSIPPPIPVASLDETTQRDDQHQHRRRFIGPLPTQIISQEITKHKKRRRKANVDPTGLDDASEDESLKDAVYHHARTFLHRSGRDRDDWGEDDERGMREEVYRRWRESEWGRAFMRHKNANTDKRWIGTSFDVGVFLGVDILERQAFDSKITASSPAAGTSTSRQVVPSTTAETFVTAQSYLSPSQGLTHTTSSRRISRQGEALSAAIVGTDDESQSANSSTALIKPQSLTPDGTRPEALRSSAHDIAPSSRANNNILKGAPTANGSPSKGKGKIVHYSATVVDDDPAPPTEVLERSGEAVNNTSAGAAEQAEADHQVPWGEIILRDRAFVKFSLTDAESLPSNFDEWQNRTTGHLYNEDWAEYIVVWRKNRIELYRNHHMPGKDWLTGHKKLVFVIPLGQSTTRLSVYSFVDMTFCIVCPPAPIRHRSKRRWLYSRKSGLNIFVFKMRSRTRAVDWVWKLWRQLSGQLPPSLDIGSPLFDTRIKIDIPDTESSGVTAAYAVFDRDNVIRLSQERLKKFGEYKSLIEQRLTAGAELALAWRSETNLDWVWQLNDVQGNPRQWAVLCGLALNQSGRAAHLEIRMKQHFPTRLHLKDGTRLDEPPAIEGYVERIRPNSQLKQALYLTTHNGYLFALPQTRAHQPPPPGLVPLSYDKGSFRREEVKRGTRQILDAMGMMDLRSIVAVRRAFQLVPRNGHEPPPRDTSEWEDTQSFWDDVERTESDDEDPGGDPAINPASDKSRLHMRRSFELLLTSGNVVRFEAFSSQTALEWIVRMRPLISYWKQRHKADTQNEMDLVFISTGRARITPPQHVVDNDAAPEPLPDPQASLPELSSLYNWCVLDGCRPILKSGKIYARKGLWGQYKHVQLVLIAGNLVQYSITGGKSLHHRRYRVIDLVDAWLCSGYLAAQYLPEGQYNADAPHVARRYQDGLETDDGLEDTLFMLWHRPTKLAGDLLGNPDPAASSDIPKLETKRKISVFRTRSKVERDTWVWAINAEIEKIIRTSQEREDRIRETDNIVKT